MKVLLAHCYYRSSAPSGEDSVFQAEKKLLEKNNIEVIMYEKHNDNVDVSTVSNRIHTAINTMWSKSSYKETIAIIKKYKPDVAHFHNTFPQLSPSVYQACYDCSVPVIQTLHNYRLICPGGMLLRDGESCELCLDSSVLPYWALKFKCYRDSLLATAPLALMVAKNRLNGSYKNNVSRYISLTNFARDRFIRGGLPAARVTVKPNFLEFSTDINLEKENYAVFVGRLSDEKGIRTLLSAWKDIDNCVLKVLGDGHLRGDLERMVTEQGINVEFLGFQSQDYVLKVVAKAKVQIIPSECYEGFPMSVLEAFACGTPVVASCLGSLQEIIDDGDTGVLFEPKNTSDLISKVMRLLGDKSKRVDLASNARAVFDEKYSQEVNFKLLVSIYNTAINEMDS